MGRLEGIEALDDHFQWRDACGPARHHRPDVLRACPGGEAPQGHVRFRWIGCTGRKQRPEPRLNIPITGHDGGTRPKDHVALSTELCEYSWVGDEWQPHRGHYTSSRSLDGGRQRIERLGSAWPTL